MAPGLGHHSQKLKNFHISEQQGLRLATFLLLHQHRLAMRTMQSVSLFIVNHKLGDDKLGHPAQ